MHRYDSNVEGEAVVKETLLDENDDVWRSLRHQHIAVASQSVLTILFSYLAVCAAEWQAELTGRGRGRGRGDMRGG